MQDAKEHKETAGPSTPLRSVASVGMTAIELGCGVGAAGVDDVEFFGGEAFGGQVAVETEEGIAEGIAELSLSRAMGMNDGGAAVVSGAPKRLRDNTEHGDGVVAVNIDFGDGRSGV